MAAGRPAAFACRQGDRPQPPELALPGEDAAGARSRPPSLGKLACRPGESGRLTHNIDAKLAEVAETAARIGLGMMPRPPACTLRKY